MLNFTWSENNGLLWTWISIARTNYSPFIYGTNTVTRTTKNPKKLRSKKRFTRVNKISKVKRDSQPFFLKMPYYKNKFIVKTIHIRMFLYHLFKTLSINFPEFCELAEIESGSVSRFFLDPQYCWSSNQLQLW